MSDSRSSTVRIVAISGSTRAASTNTALLSLLAEIAPAGVEVTLYDGVGSLPVFSQDMEGAATPQAVSAFKRLVAASDGVIIACPEYVRSLPGGLKNAIDWLVSGDEVIAKPIVLAHASYRGDDMLETLRTVLSTVSENFEPGIFLRIALNGKTPEEVRAIVLESENRALCEEFLRSFAAYCDVTASGRTPCAGRAL